MADSQLKDAILFDSSLSDKSRSTSVRNKRSLSDFVFVEKTSAGGIKSSELGKGAFGAVKLVKDVTTGKQYAMKIVGFLYPLDQKVCSQGQEPLKDCSKRSENSKTS